MSFDRKIDQLCPHEVRDEFLYLGGDRQTVTPMRPVASVNSISVLLNGELEVPPDGISSPAQLVGSKEGPFKVTPANNTISLIVNGGATQVAGLPSSQHMTVGQMVDRLNRQVSGVTFSQENNRLKFQSDLIGPDASVYILPSSTLGGLVGFPIDRAYRGRVVVPAWSVINDPNTLNDRPTRLVYFDEPLKGYADYVEISYVTLRQECRRCGGVGIENDWSYARGLVVEVRDEALLLQEMLKAVYTSRGSNPFHPGYGSTLMDRIGSKVVSYALLQNFISSDIQQVFSDWQSVKTSQETVIGQYVSDKEFPFRLAGVDIEQSNKDPTVVFVTITVHNRSLQRVELVRGLRLPEPLELAGASQTQALARRTLRNNTFTG